MTLCLLNNGVAGEFDAWRFDVAATADGNSALTFAISAAFAAPMLRVLGGEGGGFHFRGNSSTGKSALLVAAGSVWGGSHGEHSFGHTWRGAANALESVALTHNDTLLCLDEFTQVSPAEAVAAANALANGQGKARLKADGSLSRAEWLVLFLSSGETSLADHMASSLNGGRCSAGQDLRLLDVPAEAGAGMGVWETVHGMGDANLGQIALKRAVGDELSPAEKRFAGARQSDLVTAAARTHYGHAGPVFLERLASARAEAVTLARAIMATFVAACGRQYDGGPVDYASQRFALVGAAGELAIAWGIVPWPPGSAVAAALALYRRWAEAFGRDALREEQADLGDFAGSQERGPKL